MPWYVCYQHHLPSSINTLSLKASKMLLPPILSATALTQLLRPINTLSYTYFSTLPPLSPPPSHYLIHPSNTPSITGANGFDCSTSILSVQIFPTRPNQKRCQISGMYL